MKDIDSKVAGYVEPHAVPTSVPRISEHAIPRRQVQHLPERVHKYTRYTVESPGLHLTHLPIYCEESLSLAAAAAIACALEAGGLAESVKPAFRILEQETEDSRLALLDLLVGEKYCVVRREYEVKVPNIGIQQPFIMPC